MTPNPQVSITAFFLFNPPSPHFSHFFLFFFSFSFFFRGWGGGGDKGNRKSGNLTPPKIGGGGGGGGGAGIGWKENLLLVLVCSETKMMTLNKRKCSKCQEGGLAMWGSGSLSCYQACVQTVIFFLPDKIPVKFSQRALMQRVISLICTEGPDTWPNRERKKSKLKEKNSIPFSGSCHKNCKLKEWNPL